MGKIIRKFFDAEGKEAAPEDAVSCEELELDEDGNVVTSAWYHAKEETAKGAVKSKKDTEEREPVKGKTKTFIMFDKKCNGT